MHVWREKTDGGGGVKVYAQDGDVQFAVVVLPVENLFAPDGLEWEGVDYGRRAAGGAGFRAKTLPAAVEIAERRAQRGVQRTQASRAAVDALFAQADIGMSA